MPEKKRSSGLKWFIILLLLAGVAGGVVYYLKRPAKSAIDYKEATITKGDITQSVTANGQLNAVKMVQVGSQVSGIINKINVDFNSKVSAGDIIAQIDPSTLQQGVDQAEAELANAQAALELTEVNYKRAKELRTSELIPVSDLDKALADYHQAQAIVRMRDASLKKAKVDLERTTIFAPISGVVISRNVDSGQTVAASFNTPTLFLIANDLTKMQIEAMVSEVDVGGVEEGQRVDFTVDAFQGRQFHGKVSQVRFAPTTNQNVVTYATIVAVDNADMKLRPGMTANASIVTAEKQNVVKLPNAALRFRPPETAMGKATNSAAGKTNRVASGSGAATSGTAAGPGGPGGSSEERRQRLASMSPEERQAMRDRWMASGGGGQGGGGPPRQRREGPVTRTVYLLKKSADGKETPEPVTVKTGITDGAFTEVIDGLKEGDVVITGVNLPAPAATAMGQPGASPFGPRPFGGGGGGGGGVRPR